MRAWTRSLAVVGLLALLGVPSSAEPPAELRFGYTPFLGEAEMRA